MPEQKFCVEQPNDLILVGGPRVMLPVPDRLEIKLHNLRGKRKLLSERFENNPNETRRALELKILEDQIAEFEK